MVTQQTTERNDGVTTERTTTVQDGGTATPARSGNGATGIVAILAILALVAIVAYFLLRANGQEAAETNAVTNAAESVGEAAQGAGEAVERAVQ